MIAASQQPLQLSQVGFNKYSLWLVPLAMLSTVIAAIVNGDFSTLVAFLLLLLPGLLFRNTARHLYWSILSEYCIFSFLFAMGFLWDHGDPFIGGGDDELFYEFSIRAYKYGLDDFDAMLDAMNYKGVLIFFSIILGFLDLFAVNDVSHFSLVLFNCALGAGAITLFYLGALRISYFKVVRLSLPQLLLAGSFPITLFYSSVFLRDCWITFLFSFVFYLNLRFPSMIKRVVLSLPIIAVAYAIRPASAAFILVFLVSYNFFNASRVLKLFWATVILFAGLYLAGNVEAFLKSGSIDEVMLSYSELSAEEASGNSLGLKLIQSSNPILKLASFVYLVLSPIPPPVFFKLNFHHFILSLGSLSWYFIFPTVLYAYFRNLLTDKSKALSSFLIAVLASIIVVAFSTNNARHIQFVYPLFLLIFLGLVRTRAGMVKTLFKLYVVIVCVLAVAYLFVKFVLL